MPPSKNKRAREESPDPGESHKKAKMDESDSEDDGETGTEYLKAVPCGSGLRSPVSSHNKPAELFRKDLISAMKLADSEQLNAENYLLISDPWRQEWEKGVQVPVNEKAIPDLSVSEMKVKSKGSGDFKIPKKLLHSNKDETFQQGIHELTGMQQLSEEVVRYDLDDMDVCWLRRANEEREQTGEILIDEWVMETVIEGLEAQCHERMQQKKKTEEGLGIEYDEDVVCAVCASPESEECNEMVFCDGCDICVHQACYGIQAIPEGSWLCRTCALGIKPTCILCPKTGGAMKSTRSGTKWAHVNCALWIPEVSIGCVEKMEPVTKISQIPASRWALICCVCKERQGACIQCSVKSCKTAFHVSCAFSSNLEMKTLLTDESADDGGVKLKAYCPRHSNKKGERRGSESDGDSPRKSLPGSPRKELTDEEIAKMRAEKMRQLTEEFYTVIDSDELAASLNLDPSAVELISEYWKLKRKTVFDVPMLTPKTEEEDLLEKQQEDSLVARMKMFVQLRQDLERVRNLCYMVSKREKVKKQFYKSHEAAFMALAESLNRKSYMSDRDAKRIAQKWRFDSIYDQQVFHNMKYRQYDDIVDDEKEEIIDQEESKIVEEEKTEKIKSPTEKAMLRENLFDAMQASFKQNDTPTVSPGSDASISGKKSRGRPRKYIKSSHKTEELPQPETDDQVKNDTDNVKLSEPHVQSARKLRSNIKSSIKYEEVDSDIDMHSESKVEELSPRRRHSRHRSGAGQEAMVREKQSTPAPEQLTNERELRSSSNKNNSADKTVKNELIFSNKHDQVSDRVKHEVRNLINTNKLVVSDRIREKVQRTLLQNGSKNGRSLPNGFVQAQLTDTVVNGRRALDEISPSRTRQRSIDNNSPVSPRANLSTSKKLILSLGSPRKTPDKVILDSDHDVIRAISPGPETRSVRRRIDNVFDVFKEQDFSRRSSRENSPDVGSDPLSNFKTRNLLHGSERVTRASSPASSCRSRRDSHNSEFIDVENIDIQNTQKRVTRSQVADSGEFQRFYCQL
ncbi:hypothetical protein FSP39_021267 [Pinctada imbricata]|uniref:Protein Jade-1 n=1 Tax=Pinctada imbricata TaxID=66713 RepID=A0AA89C977_PINIB|nr:hypothetical protein FSP39_021267 [Pinctada imbricata]